MMKRCRLKTSLNTGSLTKQNHIQQNHKKSHSKSKEADDEIEEDDDTVKVDDNSETADTSMSEAIMKKTAKDERVRMRRGRDSGKNTIFDNWDDEGEDEDGL